STKSAATSPLTSTRERIRRPATLSTRRSRRGMRPRPIVCSVARIWRRFMMISSTTLSSTKHRKCAAPRDATSDFGHQPWQQRLCLVGRDHSELQ
ncbi:hypothetical protein PENTCL1PPCAC_8362, partial [Pristionchus entomophagus]